MANKGFTLGIADDYVNANSVSLCDSNVTMITDRVRNYIFLLIYARCFFIPIVSANIMSNL